jgi:putative flavoprotein involved in K+ transport
MTHQTGEDILSTTTETLDVLIIGGGQAGLAISYQLREVGLHYLIVERNSRLGESWRQRFDSLELFTPRNYSALPGLPLAGDPDGYPTKDEIADYLEAYAAYFELPVALGTGIERLEQSESGFRATTTTGHTITARSVVIATGAFQQPAVPAVARKLDMDVAQLTPETYKNPRQIQPGTVLVVGDGATGRQIARELSDTHRVLLSTGRPRRVSKERILGKHLFWWLDKTGLIRASRDSRLGRKLRQADAFPGKHLDLDRLRERGITVTGRLTGAAGRQVSFADGVSADIDAVIWATGYRDRSDWVAIPEVKDASGTFIETFGISPVPGLTFIGRSWQRSRGSAVLAGVGADAADVARHLIQNLATSTQPGPRFSVVPDAAVRVPATALDPTG